jgi:hypothetical protein
MRRHLGLLSKLSIGIACAITLAFVSVVLAQTQRKEPAQAQPQPTAASKTPDFLIHAFHKEKFDGNLQCNLCHTAKTQGSVELERPGHEQCEACHKDDFEKELKQVVCAQCHQTFPPQGESDLLPFPRYKNTRALLFQFSHASHVDQKERNTPQGFRADCTFCHKFDAGGVFAKFPGHSECATCHAKPGMKPLLNASLDVDGCRGCHSPEEIENPGFTKDRRLISQVTVSGKYVDIRFSHIAHFQVKDAFEINCTTCHYAVPKSTSLADLTLPQMLDCVGCHDTSKRMPAQFRMSNCSTCHASTVEGLFSPASHNRNIKPAFHTEVFRKSHDREASAPDAKCFVCHQDVRPSTEYKDKCTGCHSVMTPASHTTRWKDDLHGKYAAIDRRDCTTCHTTDYCSRCHNELPRSHVPLPIYRGGGHAQSAMLDERACFTCHTMQNTCAECHASNLRITPGLK